MAKNKHINIIGRGNVATHLYKALSDFEVNMINPHTLDGLDRNADVIIISVKDDAISEVSDRIGSTNAIVAHTSGSTSIDVLQMEDRKYGVFYPLQTFSKNIELDYTKIPFFIEGVDIKTECILKEIAGHISNHVYTADSHKRKIIHIASVFSCNFVNHLWGVANEILQEEGLPFSVITPLIEESVRKAEVSGNPYSVQTGPAIRNDINIMSTHLSMLDKYPELQEIYSILSKSIQRTSKSK